VPGSDAAGHFRGSGQQRQQGARADAALSQRGFQGVAPLG